jgi:hypothetical protein
MKSTHTSCSDLGESYILQNFFQHYFRVYAHTNHFTTRYIINVICCLSSAELRSTNIFIHDFFSTLQQQGRKWIYYSKQNFQNYDHLIVLANSAVAWNTIATGIIKTADHYIYSINVCSYSTPLHIKVTWQANNYLCKCDKICFCTSNTQYNVPIITQFLTWKITHTHMHAHPQTHTHACTHTHSHTSYVCTYVCTHAHS